MAAFSLPKYVVASIVLAGTVITHAFVTREQ